ncbi:hypothetical protein [Nocardia wallacei]|uniref:hypothetical protein n=1 Tax=Nocardia wallacei TaxID=480035 RepID=UPI0024559835|nr:hypothetical protein [Nocardia wallacei]
MERLQRSRQRILNQRAAQREREKAVTAAVRDYLAAWHAIGLAQARRDHDIAALQQQITDVTTETARDIESHEHDQALAAAAIRARGHSDDEIAALLEIPVKRVRHLLALARRTDTPVPETDTETAVGTTPPRRGTGHSRNPSTAEHGGGERPSRGSGEAQPGGDRKPGAAGPGDQGE